MAAKRLVILGGGIAGVTLADEVRRLTGEFEITIIERENHPLYSKVLLPHYLHGKTPREKVFLKTEAWYGEKNIEWLRGQEVLRVDEINKAVEISDGREIPYDVLVIAMGGDVKLADFDAPGVCYLRGIDDAENISATVARMRAQKFPAHGVVYGSSFIALEFVNYFVGEGLKTTMVMRGAGMWSKDLLPEVSEKILSHIEKAGVQILRQIQITDAKDGDTGLEVVLDNGKSLKAGILGVGVGVAPELAALKDTAVAVDNGVVTDEFMRTNVADIYAIGDIAHFYSQTSGRHITTGNWVNAIMQAKALAQTLCKEPKSYNLVTSYTTMALGLAITFIGDTDKSFSDDVRALEMGQSLVQVFDRAGATVGAVIIGPAMARPEITKAIELKQKYGA